jgi:hypothetical protein
VRTSPRFTARAAGLFELLEALTSGFGQVIVPAMLVVSGSSATTAANVLRHELLFRLCLVAALIAVACHIAWTFLFYELFKPVDRGLSLLAVFVSLVAIALQAVSALLQFAPVIVLHDSFGAFTTEQLQILALMLLKLSAQAFYVYLVLFGFWCVLIGHLISRSTFMPRLLGISETVAGLCWLTFLWPPLAHYLSPYNQGLAAVGELSVIFWLIVMSVNDKRWEEQAGAA